MGNETYRRCNNCGEVSLNEDYCPNCGNIVNITLKRELERKAKVLERQKSQADPEKKSAVTRFLEDVKDHENLIIRYVARFFYSIWLVVIAIGSFLALLFGYIAA